MAFVTCYVCLGAVSISVMHLQSASEEYLLKWRYINLRLQMNETLPRYQGLWHSASLSNSGFVNCFLYPWNVSPSEEQLLHLALQSLDRKENMTVFDCDCIFAKKYLELLCFILIL